VSAAGDPDTLAHLALEDLHGNRAAAAESKCLQALSLDRRHPGALSVLGMLLHSQGRDEDAVRVFNALAQFEPGNAEHWGNLGAALRPTKRYDEALAAYGRALQLGAVSTHLLYNVGVLHMDRCDYDSAYRALSQAESASPLDAGIRCALAQCCYDLGRPEETLAILEDWQNLQGLTPELTAQIAYLLVTTGEPRRAEPAIRRVADNARRGWRASLTLVRVLERVNRLREARETMQRLNATPGTLSTDPDVLLAEAVLAARADAHEDACRFLTLALQDHSDFKRRHHVLFPLAKSLDALHRHEQAFAAAVEAHRSQLAFLQAATGKTPEKESPAISAAQHGCDPEDIAAWNEAPPTGIEADPIFIVAFPRSGTTLLEQILDAHPSLKSMDERPYLKRALDDVTDLGVRYPAELRKLTAVQLHQIRARYWQQVRSKVEVRPGQRLVDKNPLNMLRLPLIRRLFPNARTILAVRHPCDTLLSCFLQHFRAPDLALTCRDLSSLASSYRSAFDCWYAQLPQLAAATYELRYEALVGDFGTEIRKLSEFLELSWDAAMLAPGEHARAKGFISTPSYAQVTEPINRKSVGRWQNYEPYFKEVLPVLRPYLERWNYAH
jgi:Flp pilus assembly protein TadD